MLENKLDKINFLMVKEKMWVFKKISKIAKGKGQTHVDY